MAKIKKPKKEDYEKQTNGQGVGQTTGTQVSDVNNSETVRTISNGRNGGN